METLIRIYMQLMGFMEDLWCRSEEFGRKNATGVLSGEGMMCVKYMA